MSEPKQTGKIVDSLNQLYSLGVWDINQSGDDDSQAVTGAKSSWSPCPICESLVAAPAFRLEGMPEQVWTCEKCGLGQLIPRPDADRLATFYPAAYYGTQGAKFEWLTESLIRVLSWRRAQFLVRDLPAGARVLDIGCGRGTILTAIARLSFEAHGLERDSAATTGIKGDITVRIASDLNAAAYPAQFFQLVVLWHVLEHLSDLSTTIQEIHRLLAPGGRLVIAVPNFSSRQARWAGADWFHLDLPRHLFHLPAEALRKLLENNGFEVRSEHHFSLRHNPFGWVQSWLNRLGWFPRNGLYVSLQRHETAAHFTWRTRCLMRLCYYLLMPFAVLLSIHDSLIRRGATVHVVAVRPMSSV